MPARADFIRYLGHEHFSQPGLAKSILDMILEGRLGEINLSDKQVEKLKLARAELMSYLRYLEGTRAIAPFAGEGNIPRKRVSIQAILRDMVSEYAVAADQKKIRFTITSRRDFAIVTHQEIVWNALSPLVQNAVKYGDPDSEVKLTIRHGDRYAEILIENHSPSLKATERARLGEQGYRVDDAEPGTGLGIYFAKQFAKLLGGDILFPRTRGRHFSVQIIFPQQDNGVDSHAHLGGF